MRNNNTIRIVATSIFIAMVAVVTSFWFPTPGASGGWMHLGTLILLIISLRFGPYYGAVAGGVGMTLADLLTGGALWAPGTLVVASLIGLTSGYIAGFAKDGQGSSFTWNVLAWAVAFLIKVVGYYLYEAVFLTTFEAATISVIGNLVQFAFAFAAIPIVLYTFKIDIFNSFAKDLLKK